VKDRAMVEKGKEEKYPIGKKNTETYFLLRIECLKCPPSLSLLFLFPSDPCQIHPPGASHITGYRGNLTFPDCFSNIAGLDGWAVLKTVENSLH
jgi:hypothetical protein